MIPWLAGIALAADVLVTAPAGPVRPGRPAALELVAVDDAGEPLDGVELVAPEGGGTIRLERDEDAPAGTTRWLYTPPARAGEVVLRARGPGLDEAVPVRLVPAPEPPWSAPDDIRAPVGRAVRVRIDGDVPPPEALVVEASEDVQVVREVGEGSLTLQVMPQPDGGARVLLLALRDLRSDTAPRIVTVRLVERPVLAFDLEAGATLTVRVGGRTYGPFRSEGDGPVRAPIEQRPGERQAELIVADDLGNELVTPYVLAARAEPVLVAVPARPLWPGGLTPEVLLAARRPDGGPWRGAAPSCRAVGTGDVAVQDDPSGLYRVELPPRAGEARELRLSCTLGQTRARPQVRLLPVPDRIELRVWPDEVSTDFPVAEVTARLLDGAGERLPVADLQVSARRGLVQVDEVGGETWRGEYRGGPEAIREGRDAVTARWTPAPRTGWPVRVEVAHGAVPGEGAVTVWGRALDDEGHPLIDVPLLLRAGDTTARARTGPDGWATAELDPGSGPGPVEVGAASAGLEARRAVPRGARPAQVRPGRPDRTESRVIRLTAGRVSTVSVELDTPVLILTPEATLTAQVYLYDRSDSLVSDEIPVLSVDEGTVGRPRLRPDGGFDVVYTPPPDGRARSVTLVARAPTGSASATARLRLEPRPVIAAVGASAGVISNLGALTSALFSVDGDLRLPALNGQLVARFGVAGYSVSRTTPTDLGEDRKRLTVLPLTLAALVRQERGRTAGWLGVGPTVAPFHAVRIFEDTRLPARSGVLPPGFTALVGGARRVGGGEVALELRGTFLSSPGGTSGFAGQVGGIGATLGYRLVID